MASRKRDDEPRRSQGRPPTTPRDREHHMVNLAMETAERQLRDGSASSQVLTHFLKAGSLREELEQTKLTYETELLKEKKSHLQEMASMKDMYSDALRAMSSYQGNEPPPEDDYED